MAIIKCDDGVTITEEQTDSTTTTVNADGSVTTINADGSTTTVYIDGTIITKNVDGTVTIISPDGVETNMSSSDYLGVIEEYVDQDKVSLGKKLLAVENEAFSKLSISLDSLPEVRNEDIADTFRADTGLYWTLTSEAAMKHPGFSYVLFGDPVIGALSTPSAIGLEETYVSLSMIGSSMGSTSVFPNDGVWKVFIEGGDYYKGDVKEFSRPSPLVPVGQAFSDHAFEMSTPFSKKELKMFENISNAVSVADVESDYDFYFKAYEKGIASVAVPENSLPHLYTEVQRGESEEENTSISGPTTERTVVKEGYFREWMNKVLYDSNTDVNEMASRYENVAILDSVIDATNFIDSETQTISAFDILMAYANRENLFPMNMNIEIDTNNASNVMSEAEDVGMVDDIVRLLMGEGNVVAVTETETPTMDPDDAPGVDVSFDYAPAADVWTWVKIGSKISYYFDMNYDQEKDYTNNNSDSKNLWNLIRGEFDSYGGYKDDSTFVHYVFGFIDNYVESKDTKNGTHNYTYELNSNNYMYSHDGGATYVQHGSSTDNLNDTKVEITVDEDNGWAYIMLYALENRG